MEDVVENQATPEQIAYLEARGWTYEAASRGLYENFSIKRAKLIVRSPWAGTDRAPYQWWACRGKWAAEAQFDDPISAYVHAETESWGQ